MKTNYFVAVVAALFCASNLLAAPAITNLSPSQIGVSGARWNAMVTSTNGSATTARVYWGASDGATTFSAWSHTNTVTTNATQGLMIYTNVSGLSAATIYYARWFATNAQDGVWAGWSTNLTTMAAPLVAGGDNLGNHTATQALNMNEQDISAIRHLQMSAADGEFDLNGNGIEFVNAADGIDFVTGETIAQIGSDFGIDTTASGRNLFLKTSATNSVIASSFISNTFADMGGQGSNQTVTAGDLATKPLHFENGLFKGAY